MSKCLWRSVKPLIGSHPAEAVPSFPVKAAGAQSSSSNWLLLSLSSLFGVGRETRASSAQMSRSPRVTRAGLLAPARPARPEERESSS
eukprot:scaffold288596_cov32-Tisochrysis_lutea.AAC.1